MSAVASDLGCATAHTPAGADDPGQADLLRGELELFAADTIAPPIARRPGRPPGSPNRSTLQLRKLLLQTGYRDPAEFLAATMTMSTAELATALDCDRLEALKVQRQCASDLLPYFHQRLPQEEDRKPAEARPLVVIMEGSARVGIAAADGTLSAYDVQQDQALSASAPDKSHDTRSHDDG